MPEPRFIERIDLMAPPGTQAALRDAARNEGQTVSEFVRQAIRQRLRQVDSRSADTTQQEAAR